MRNKHISNTRMKSFFSILVFMLSIFCTQVISADSEKVNLELFSTNNGIPNIGYIYNAYNLDTAYEKIATGNITAEETTTVNWKNIQNQTPNLSSVELQNNIQLPDGKKVGPGITHDPDEAMSIFETLLHRGALPLLTELNGETEGILFHQPSRWKMSNNFTNNQGEAVALVKSGLIAITSQGGSFQKLVRVNKDHQRVDLDTANLDNRVEFNLKGFEKEDQTNLSRYVVKTGEPLTYTLRISKYLNEKGGILNLKSTDNLSIRSVVAANDEIVVTPEATGEGKLNPNQEVTFPPLNEDLILTITADILPPESQKDASAPMYLSVNTVDDNEIPIMSQSPVALLSGINFLMADTLKNTMATGAEYMLGRNKENKLEVYSSIKGWTQIESLETMPTSSATILKGGYQYIMGVKDARPIPQTLTRFNYNAEQNNKINQSLIQLIGFPQGDNYFLYQVKAADGFNLNQNLIDFSVFTSFEVRHNGYFVTRSSIREAQFQNFQLNTAIPDFKSGNNEYNILSVTEKGKKSHNIWLKIILPIILVVLVIIVIVVFFLKNL